MKVISYRAINKGMIVGCFNLLLKSGMILQKCMLIQTREGGLFAALPAEKAQQADGSHRYFPLITFENTELKNNFCNEMLTTVKNYLRDNPELRNATTYTTKKSFNEYEEV